MDTRPQGYSSVGRASVSKTAPYSRDFSGLGALSYQDVRRKPQERDNSGSRIAFPSVIAIREVCWACKGTGYIFAGVSPIRFRRCFMCNGVRGRGVPRGGQPVNCEVRHG